MLSEPYHSKGITGVPVRSFEDGKLKQHVSVLHEGPIPDCVTKGYVSGDSLCVQGRSAHPQA